MDDMLPLVGVFAGWFLSEASSYLKRRQERFKSLGKAVAVLYYLNMEMVQVRHAFENFKNMSADLADWERYRKKAFAKYADTSDSFSLKIEEAIGYVSEFYPMDAYELRDVFFKYQFYKTKDFASLVSKNSELYLKILSQYELGYLTYQYVFERSLLKLAFRHSLTEWARMKWHIKKANRIYTSNKEIVFGSQIAK